METLQSERQCKEKTRPQNSFCKGKSSLLVLKNNDETMVRRKILPMEWMDNLAYVYYTGCQDLDVTSKFFKHIEGLKQYKWGAFDIYSCHYQLINTGNCKIQE